MNDETIKKTIYFPPGLYDKLKLLADSNERSLSAQVVYILNFVTNLPKEQYRTDTMLLKSNE